MKIIAIEDLPSTGHSLTEYGAYRAVQIIEKSILPVISQMKGGMVAVRMTQGVVSHTLPDFLMERIKKHLGDHSPIKTDFKFQSIGFYPKTFSKIELLVRMEMERMRNFTGDPLLLVLVTPPEFVFALDKKDKFVFESREELNSGPIGDSITVDMEKKIIWPFIFQDMDPTKFEYRAA